MKLRYLSTALIVMAISSVQAFGQRETIITGQLYSQSTFNYTDILRMSQFNNGYGTARSTAMGGAFTSLGADLSSMFINPAGLGMYRSSEFSFTPAVTIGQISNSSVDPIFDSDNKRTRFTLNSAGVALNLYQGTGALTSFTFGFAYNKLADFNYRTSVRLQDDKGTIGDIFARQLSGYRASDIQENKPWSNSSIPIFDWGAVLGYKSWFIDSSPYDDPNATDYDMLTVSPDATIEHYIGTESKGSIGEYAISGGFNFRNKLYIGFSLGLQDIYWRQNVNYTEAFPDNEGVITDYNSQYITELSYRQYKKLSGSGVNFKVGAIYRPTDALRIGVAVHTPTFSTVRMEYQASMDGYYSGGEESHGWGDTPYYVYDYDFMTPTRLMGGISYSFGDMGVLSFDYERTWYNGMRYTNDDGYNVKDWYRTEIKHLFKGGNTFRVGGELKPVPIVAFRAGFMWSGSLVNEDNFVINLDKFDSPVAYETYNISGGVGFRLGRSASLDVTYVYMNTKYTEYDIYLYQERDAGNHDTVYGEVNAGFLRRKLDRHNIMMTLAFRF